ncbi:hypothetical protein GpartN1_g6018.t1 [Galdieria partita]|uniref:Hemerythrin-like domain-containing protein n=1 Tax=Galdieria partita TaxID=83374 RepID=A0A9C7UT09_9RHOD|nr:hypothetical protein GpartN1_g6018.t1 [Galdieria partita]
MSNHCRESTCSDKKAAPPFSWSNCDANLKITDASPKLDWFPELFDNEALGQPSFQCYNLQRAASSHLRVQLSRSFLFDDEKNEFRWHKTWKLPEVRVVYRPPDSFSSNDLTAWITCVCHTDLSNTLEVLGLEGITRQPLVDGQCTFSRLRFKSTSSLQRGRPFYLIVSILRQRSCLASLISNGIYVYSRKDADKKRKRTESVKEATSEMVSADEAYTFYSPFLPELFDRIFFRKGNDHRGQKVVERIENSPEGLLSYFQAPNIRFKCRHPVFLLYRFSNALVLLRDSELFPSETAQVYRSFISDLGTFPTEAFPESNALTSTENGDSPNWYICCRQGCKCTTEARRKIFENMDLLKSDKLGFIADSSLCDPKFKALMDMESLRLEYERFYALFSSNKKKPREEKDSKGSISSDVQPLHNTEAGLFDEVELPSFLQVPNTSHLTCQYSVGDAEDEWLAFSTEARLFKERFQFNHLEIRRMLSSLTDAAVNAVTDHSEACISHLQRVYAELFTVLSAHANVEDQLIFPLLMDRIPGITESYNLDHFMEGKELTAIGDAITNFDPNHAGDLFLRITGFSANLTQHMEKEEEHILPRLLQILSDDELNDLRNNIVRETCQMLQRGHTSSARQMPTTYSHSWIYSAESPPSKDTISEFFS